MLLAVCIWSIHDVIMEVEEVGQGTRETLISTSAMPGFQKLDPTKLTLFTSSADVTANLPLPEG